MTKPPQRKGFFWAKWVHMDEGTTDYDCFPDGYRSHHEWEPVEMVENHINDGEPDQWRVSVNGVERSQSPENFIWGDEIIRPA